MRIWQFLPIPSFRASKAPQATDQNDKLLDDVNQLCTKAKNYLTSSQVRMIRRAYEFGAAAHIGQKRVSGEPYISHPVAVAQVLVDMRMDHQTLVAAILHDVLEDTQTSKSQITGEFGIEVTNLVDGVSKLTQIEFDNYAQAQAENFRKMLLAMTNDIRVILVKLADRLHNMRTLDALSAEKRRLIARETLDIYAPIANRLGINSIRIELENLGFSALYPNRYRVLSNEVKKARGNRKAFLNEIQNAIKNRLQEDKLLGEVIGREKHIYGIYKKMVLKHVSFSDVLDVYAFRIVVDSVDSAYRVLGVIHNLYKPVPGKFKDYIAIPKANGYQSLHTVLLGPHALRIEVQIRTNEMHEVAERGIAAHWLYKNGTKISYPSELRTHEWLRNILELQKQSGNSQEFLENVKIDLFPDEIYLFTPKGDIIKLPRGACAIDFAYAVHSAIGDSCVAARVNRKITPLSVPLSTGQTVEIISSQGSHPKPSWLNFVITSKARSHIRHFLKSLDRDEAREFGRKLLIRELQFFDTTVEMIPEEQVKKVLSELKLRDFDELLEEIGLGSRLAPLVARFLVSFKDEDKSSISQENTDKTRTPLAIRGTEGMVVNFPKCCYPIPGDTILGYLSMGRGIVIHRQTCKNLVEFRNHPEKWVDVEWGDELTKDFSAEIRIMLINQRGALATVAAAIAELGANIESVEMAEKDDRYMILGIVIAVRDRQHLARVIRSVRILPAVERIHRT